jgi:hypothetical protein
VIQKRFANVWYLLLALTLILSGCNMPAATPTSTTGGAPSGGLASTGGRQICFVNLTKGGSIQATMAKYETDAVESPPVMVQVEVTG